MDDLRERVAELAGINLTDFLEEGKGAGSGGQTQGGKAKAKVGCENIKAFQIEYNICRHQQQENNLCGFIQELASCCDTLRW